MTRAVVATSVLVSALIGGAASTPALVVRACREARLTLVASPRLLDELTGVLERSKFDRWTGDGRGFAYVAGLAAIAEMRDDVPAPPSVTDDAGDDFLIALATSSSADYLTSVDRHLLAAQTDVVVLTPAQLLETHPLTTPGRIGTDLRDQAHNCTADAMCTRMRSAAPNLPSGAPRTPLGRRLISVRPRDDRAALPARLDEGCILGLMSQPLTLTAVFTPDEDGWTMAQLAEWPAIVTCGRTVEEARELLLDAAREMIASYRDEGREPPIGGGHVEQVTIDVAAA